ncbi:hypothetical protein [Streptomyces sp. ZL-24]|uniref:hypothetical protein n=1 Tax=Streptomyces sp. ZL-24 TaxID=1933029 RepID=UPI0011B0E7D0|nr:hypothetical protein [Streptomyces sp. ZL-24]
MALSLPGMTITADHLNSISGDWTSYTPTLTNTTLGNGSLQARYQVARDRVLVGFTLNWGSSTSGNMPVLSLPVLPASLGGMRWSGVLMLSRGTGTWRSGFMYLADSASTVSTYALYGSSGEVTSSLSTAGITMTAGGWIAGQIEYEIP